MFSPGIQWFSWLFLRNTAELRIGDLSTCPPKQKGLSRVLLHVGEYVWYVTPPVPEAR